MYHTRISAWKFAERKHIVRLTLQTLHMLSRRTLIAKTEILQQIMFNHDSVRLKKNTIKQQLKRIVSETYLVQLLASLTDF